MSDTNMDFIYSQVVSDPLAQRRENQRAQQVAVGCEHGDSRRKGDSLGTTTKSVDIGAYQERRGQRYKLQAAAKRLMPSHRVAACMCHCGSGGVEVVQSKESGIASYRGLQVCGSVWACPICSSKISNVRRAELNKLLVWGRERGYMPVLLTLTMRHGFGEALKHSLHVIKSAKKKFHQSYVWRQVKASVIGHVTATEVTYGKAGWHPHYHILLLLDCQSEDEAIALIESARNTWEYVLEREGYDCNEHGFQVQGATEAGDYVSKWGAAEEVTLSNAKVSRARGREGGKGCSPWELLAYYATGDREYGALFVVYANTFHGRRQLVWSPGLKDIVGLGDVEDKEIASIEDDQAGEVVAVIERGLWKRILKHDDRANVLQIVESEGAAALYAYLDRMRRLWSIPIPHIKAGSLGDEGPSS